MTQPAGTSQVNLLSLATLVGPDGTQNATSHERTQPFHHFLVYRTPVYRIRIQNAVWYMAGSTQKGLLVGLLLAASAAASPAAAQHRVDRPETELFAVSPEALASVRYGSAFFVDVAGHMITAGHVARDCRRLLTFVDGKLVAATLVGYSTKRDLAVLLVRPQSGSFLRLVRTPPRIGDRIVIMGYPFLDAVQSLSAFDGIVGGLTGPRGDQGAIRITAKVFPGNSGGPVLSESGGVIGVVNGRMDDRDGGIGIAVRIPEVLALLEEFSISVTRVDLPREDTGSPVARNAGAVRPLLCTGGPTS